uniref:Transglutaminase-like domain-containing protein n=1 Tax=Panagrolaimus sp. JU765 TaxID=591449 RepID=A0AC34RFR7_9BILA
MPDWLDVTSIELNPLENAEKHFTSKYQWQNESKIVVRRGLPVKFRFKTDGRRFRPEYHVIVLEFELDEKVDLKEDEKVKKIRIRMPDEATVDPLDWKAEFVRLSESFVDVEVVFPLKAPLACWKLRILSGLWTQRHQTSELEETFFSRLHTPRIYCLFNPFLEGDDVYLPQKPLREAYLFQDGELYYSGTAVGRQRYSYSKRPWMHSQFDENTLRVSLFLLTILTNNHLQNKPGLSMTERGNIVRVTRKLSFAVNRYLLRGNWDKEVPEDGKPATSWLGTAEIIECFMQTKRQVKYAQCWVYACTFVTVLRTLGIPCRTVTCIESAHDADMSLTVDRAYLRTIDGGFEPIKGIEGIEWESTWNFHVWTEIWTKRNDLPDGYDGWQVVDATPQETSEKLFQCGPMSVKAIKEGRLDLPYDGWFIYSEVNADSVRWFYERDLNGKLKLITAKFNNDTDGIGRAMLTPNPRNYGYPMDLTLDYKEKEGTNNERLVHIKALKSAGVAERHDRIRLLYGKDLDSNLPEDVEIIVEEIDKVFYGDSIFVDISVKNWSSMKRTVQLSVDTVTLFHTGSQSFRISRFNETIELEPKAGDSVRIETPISQYAQHVSYLRDLAAIVSASILETNQAIFIEEKFQLTGSSVVIEAPNITKVGAPVIAMITFQNPITEVLRNVELILHSGNLSKPTKVPRFPREVGPKQRIRIRVRFRAIGEGARLLVATINSSQIKNMTATHYVRSVHANINFDDKIHHF